MGVTVLHVGAMCYDRLESINILIEAGADVNAVNSYGETVLDVCSQKRASSEITVHKTTITC